MLTVFEIYASIQGESTYAGERCAFVRLAACDLRCAWCDTPYAFTGGTKMSIDDVLAAKLFGRENPVGQQIQFLNSVKRMTAFVKADFDITPELHGSSQYKSHRTNACRSGTVDGDPRERRALSALGCPSPVG